MSVSSAPTGPHRKRRGATAVRRARTRFVPRVEPLEDRQLLDLDPLTQPRFVNPLPVPAVMQPVEPGGTHYEVSISQFRQDLGLVDPATGKPFLTTVWGYNGSFPGATFDVRRDVPITVHWTNDLVDKAGVLPHLFEVDTSFHWANPKGWPESGVPVVPHLHGGHTESASDGLPGAWFTPGFGQVGRQWVKETYVYDNDQEAATLWYHDHTLGITRLNVYAGLAGLYLVRDDREDSLNLPRGEYEIPLVIQDRAFSDDGQLAYPRPFGSGGVFGDFVLVNGKAWPFLEVEPRKYRFRLLNGSDSRTYELSLARDPGGTHGFYHVGSEGGLLDRPVRRDRLRLAPGERADVVVDFSKLKGESLLLRNEAPAPYPDGEPPDPRTVGQVMEFRVTRPLSSPDKSVVPKILREYPDLGPAVRTRQLLLSSEDWMHQLLGTVAGGRMHDDDPVTENPGLNDVEVWEFYNTTSSAHPIHLHLATFFVLNQQRFTAVEDPKTGALSDIEFLGDPEPLGPDGVGLKDTVVVNPGRVVRVLARFDREGEFVWHCHMLFHEDSAMMRPYVVGGRGAPHAPRGLDFHAHRLLEQASPGSLAGDLPPHGHASGASAAVGPLAALALPHGAFRGSGLDHLGGLPKQVVWHKPG